MIKLSLIFLFKSLCLNAIKFLIKLNGKISNFVPQKTFRALDYNDSQQIISGYFPDLSASISISNGQSFAQNGWIYVHCPRVISGNSTVKLNNILVYEKVDTDHQNGYHTVSNTSWIPYSRNSVITTSGNFTSLIFYPVKGVK